MLTTPTRQRKHVTVARSGTLLGIATLLVAIVGFPFSRSASADVSAPSSTRLATGCTVFASTYVYADTPRLEWPRVWMTGGIEYWSPPYCWPDLSGVYAQTKACGVFGCNWQTRGAVEYTPWQGMHETPGMDCRTGTNRYRTHTVFGYRVIGETGLESGYPIVADSAIQPEFSCK